MIGPERVYSITVSGPFGQIVAPVTDKMILAATTGETVVICEVPTGGAISINTYSVDSDFTITVGEN